MDDPRLFHLTVFLPMQEYRGGSSILPPIVDTERMEPLFLFACIGYFGYLKYATTGYERETLVFNYASKALAKYANDFHFQFPKEDASLITYKDIDTIQRVYECATLSGHGHEALRYHLCAAFGYMMYHICPPYCMDPLCLANWNNVASPTSPAPRTPSRVQPLDLSRIPKKCVPLAPYFILLAQKLKQSLTQL
jgi:hypothetical protein